MPENADGPKPSDKSRSLAHHFRPGIRGVILAVILLAAFLLQLHHLSHAAVKPLDEVFHAIVARSLMRHPLTPTLVEPALLPYDYRNWLSNHIWLHKPPMALWQIALSFALLGVKPLALRLPSAILATLAAGITFLIGRQWLDRTAGLIAAALQAFCPVIFMLVHGYVFSDHVDIALLFWTELAIYLLGRAMRSGSRTDAILCGVAQGLAFLCKTYPALIVTGLAAVAWLLPETPLARRDESRLSRGKVGLILLSTAAVVLPWMLMCWIRFPDEFVYENLGILSHLNQNVEGWAAPWDRVAFDYFLSIFYVFYPAVLASVVLAAVAAFRRRSLGLWMVLAWAAGVVVPNLLATSKPLVATLVGWPALWLLLGFMISRAFRGDGWALGTWLTAMLLAVFFIGAKSIPAQGWGYPEHPGFAAILLQHTWVLWQTGIALVLGGLGVLLTRWKWARPTGRIVATAAMLVLAGRCWRGDHPRGYVCMAWQVTQMNHQTPAFVQLGGFARRLPLTAAFIVVETDRLENKLVQFAADRPCYALGNDTWQDMSAQIAEAGGLPYLVTASTAAAQPLPVVFQDSVEHRTVYACTPAALAGAKEIDAK